MGKLIKFIVIVLSLLPFKVSADNPDYIFKKITNIDGLTYNTVQSIVQDTSGVMWFATKQGLNKYNSYNITRYYFEDGVGLPSNMILSLLITKDNRLYVGTSNGLCSYDPKPDRFHPIPYEGRIIRNIQVLTESKTGVILIGSNEGIYAYSPKQKKLNRFIALQNEKINSIVECEDNLFLIATFSGIYVVNSDGKLKEYISSKNTETLPSDRITCIHKDSDGEIWVGTENDGFYKFDKTHKIFTRIRLEDIDRAEDKVIRDIQEDHKGNIWVASELGIFIYSKTRGKIINIQHSLENSDYKLNDNAVYCLFISKENIMWIGTYFGGVNYTLLDNKKGMYNIHPGKGNNELAGKAVGRIFKSSKGILWIATEDGGVCCYDPKTKCFLKNIKHDQYEGISSNNIHAICEDKYGNIWFGNFMTGIDIYNSKTKKIKNISLSPNEKYNIAQNSVYCLFKDSKGTMWIGSRAGILTYDYNSEKLIPFKYLKINNNFIYNIMEDHNGQIWFCLRHGGIISYNPTNNTINSYKHNDGSGCKLSSNQVISSYEDKESRIWFGTVDGGVNIFHPDSSVFEVITMKDGLPNNTIYGILDSDDGKIWLSSNSGISQFDYKSRKIKNFNLNDGLAQMQFNYSSYFKDTDNTLYFGHINGLTYFNPNNISVNLTKPHVLFTDFKLSNESVKIGENSVLNASINNTDKIKLSYSQKAFTIEFVATNHLSSGNNRFFYSLEGFDNHWYNNGNKTSVTYTNLSPGHYIFKLKAQNNDGIESINTKSLEITIKPPFYLTIWAYLSYFALGVLALIIYGRISVAKEKEKAALNYERIEKKKIDELSQQRLNFYTYISHEFKTPLSIIIASIDQIFENNEVSQKSQSQKDRLRRSAKRLSFLVNQLLEFRKIETKHTKLVLQRGNIIDFIKGTCMVFTPLFLKNSINFEFKSNKDEYDYWFDSDKIEKILTNLISNAIKNTPANGIISCEANISDDEQKKLKIIISDSGYGIPKEELDNLFTPFYANYNASNTNKGTGIGLTLVKSLVEFVHGSIKVSSTVNVGTVFTIILPLSYDQSSNIQLNELEPIKSGIIDIENFSYFPSNNIELSQQKNDDDFKLLIVEDTLNLAEILIEHFSENFQVSFAPNGSEALKIVNQEEPDIIISDIMMPDMDGITLCQHIKKDELTSHIAVILLTAKTDHEDKIRGLAAGAEAYITKPFDIMELDLHVRNFITLRKKLKESVVLGKELDLNKLNLQDKDKMFVKKVSEIINDNISNEALNTEELAKQIGMSKTLVYLKLKKLLNMSGTDYIQSIRLKKAIELMTTTDQSIAEIAYEIGFSDPNYFSKVFKKNYKISPTSYKKELLVNAQKQEKM